MAKLIQTATAWLDAWVEAAEFLLNSGPTLNLVLEIREPGKRGYTKTAGQRLDDFFASERANHQCTRWPKRSFPGSEYCKQGLKRRLRRLSR